MKISTIAEAREAQLELKAMAKAKAADSLRVAEKVHGRSKEGHNR